MDRIEPIPAQTDISTVSGGQCAVYRWVFNIWVVLFLGVICAGLLNYLGLYAKRFYPGL